MWFFRHQCGGVLQQFPFAQRPTAKQTQQIEAWCAAQYGEQHPVKGMPWFLTPVEVDVLGPEADIEIPPEKTGFGAPVSMSASLEMGLQYSISGEGTVTNPS